MNRKIVKSHRIRELLGTRFIKSHQHELNKENSNRCANMAEGKAVSPQPYTRNYKQLRNAEIGRNCLPQGRTHRLVIECQRANPE